MVVEPGTIKQSEKVPDILAPESSVLVNEPSMFCTPLNSDPSGVSYVVSFIVNEPCGSTPSCKGVMLTTLPAS